MSRKVVFEFDKLGLDRCTCGIGETARVMSMNHASNCPVRRKYEEWGAMSSISDVNWLDMLEPLHDYEAEYDARLIAESMRIFKTIIDNDGELLRGKPDVDCQTCGERPALENTQICPECYLKAVNELKPLTQNELNILEADFFNEPRPTELTYADARNQERVDKIEKLRKAMLP